MATLTEIAEKLKMAMSIAGINHEITQPAVDSLLEWDNLIAELEDAQRNAEDMSRATANPIYAGYLAGISAALDLAAQSKQRIENSNKAE